MTISWYSQRLGYNDILFVYLLINFLYLFFFFTYLHDMIDDNHVYPLLYLII